MREQNVSMGKSSLILTMSKLVSYAITLVSTMMLSRFRTLEEYGTYSQMLMTVNLVLPICMLGLPNTINYFLARAETQSEKNRFLSLYYTVNTILGALVGIVLVSGVPLIVKYFRNDAIFCFKFFLCIYPWTKIITESIEYLLVVLKKTTALFCYRVSHSILVVSCILVVEALKLGFLEYIILFLIVEVIYAMLVYLLAGKYSGRLRFSVDIIFLKEILSFSIPLGFSVATDALRAGMDKLFIGGVLSTEEMAIYSNAAKELPITIIASSLLVVSLPEMAKMMKKNNVKSAVCLWRNVTEFSMIIYTFFSIGLFVFSKEAMLFLYSEKYVAGASVFGIYSLCLILRATNFGLILNSLGDTKCIMQSSIISLLINFVLNVVLYNLLGIIGPAIATLISSLWNALYLLYRTGKMIKLNMSEIFPFKQVGKIIGINIVLGAMFFVLKTYLPIEMFISRTGEAFLCAFLWAGADVIIFLKDIKRTLVVLKNK